jgi:hypothetical protein
MQQTAGKEMAVSEIVVVDQCARFSRSATGRGAGQAGAKTAQIRLFVLLFKMIYF